MPFPKKSTQCLWPGLKPGLFQIETTTLIVRPFWLLCRMYVHSVISQRHVTKSLKLMETNLVVHFHYFLECFIVDTKLSVLRITLHSSLRGCDPFGQRQGSQPLARSNTGSLQFTDFPSLCACPESSLINLIGSGLNLLCLQSHSKPECCWTWPVVPISSA